MILCQSVLVIITSRRDLQLEEHVPEGMLSLHLSQLSKEDAVMLIKTLLKDIEEQDAQDLAALCGALWAEIYSCSVLLIVQ